MRFAVLGYGKIAREVMVPTIRESGHEVTVIGSTVLEVVSVDAAKSRAGCSQLQ